MSGLSINEGRTGQITNIRDPKVDLNFAAVLGIVSAQGDKAAMHCGKLPKGRERESCLLRVRTITDIARHNLSQLRQDLGSTYQDLETCASVCIAELDRTKQLFPIHREQTKNNFSSIREKIDGATLQSSLSQVMEKPSVQVGISLVAGAGAAAAVEMNRRRLETARDQAAWKHTAAKLSERELRVNEASTNKEYCRAESLYEKAKNSSLGQADYGAGKGTNSPDTRLAHRDYAKTLWETAKEVREDAVQLVKETAQVLDQAKALLKKASSPIIRYGAGPLVAAGVYGTLRLAYAPVSVALSSTTLGNADLPMQFDERTSPQSPDTDPIDPETIASIMEPTPPRETEPGIP